MLQATAPKQMSFSSFHINKFITYRINAMRINDILTETRSDEGIVSDIGSGVGKAVGATARGVGAVAGGVRGAWDAAKQGFQAGRNLVGGGGSSAASNTGGGGVNPDNIQRAQDLRAQADQLDGGNSAQQSSNGSSGGGRSSRVSRSGAGGQSTPYTGGGQNAGDASQAAAPNNAAAPAGPDPEAAKIQKLQQALQHLSGPDVERIRGMLKKRAGIAEGIVSKIAGGLGKMGRGYVDAKSAYQQGRGGDMTPQEIDLAIASMPKEQAAELLQFFDTLHPAAAGGPADSGTPTTPSPSTAPASTDPAASTTPANTTEPPVDNSAVSPPGGAAGAGAAGNGAAGAGAAGNGAAGTNTGSGFQSAGRQTPKSANYSINLPKAPAAKPADVAAPASNVRQVVPNRPAPKINGLAVRNMEESRKLRVHSSFLGMDL
jgi:hypothetical protein